ncbi:MAG: MBL fold metallo-hydrolase [Bacteroidetes bacterium]|jgi:hydroxyacylglutathione hydrolase|nr:MBL fold metallo-hydrolase [Bacteroidota bacterium]
MLYLKQFTFNPFQENTYLLYNDLNEAIIIDPGNFNNTENTILKNFISEKNLNLTRLLLTHAHIDHVLGNKFIFDQYGLLPEMNKKDLFFIQNMEKSATLYGIPFEQSPLPKRFIIDGETIYLGKYQLKCIETPGHSPGSICFYIPSNNILIGGDVLFLNSIGRTDLPLGNHQDLINSINTKLFELSDDTKVYSGHGPSTTIGHEKNTNPFLN